MLSSNDDNAHIANSEMEHRQYKEHVTGFTSLEQFYRASQQLPFYNILRYTLYFFAIQYTIGTALIKTRNINYRCTLINSLATI